MTKKTPKFLESSANSGVASATAIASKDGLLSLPRRTVQSARAVESSFAPSVIISRNKYNAFCEHPTEIL